MAGGAAKLILENSGKLKIQIAQTVLASLFLDTWFDDHQIQSMAEELCGSGLSIAELDAILRNDIAPGFVGNLLSVAGEWAFWDETEVADILTASRQENWVWRRLKAEIGYRMVTKDWQRLKAYMSGQ